MKWVRDAYHALRRACARRVWPLSGECASSPFFIIGSGRCGSTLLRRILTAHPDVFIPPEYGYLREVLAAYRQRAYRDWPRLASSVLDWYGWERSWQPLLNPIRARVQASLEDEPVERRSLARIIEAVYTGLAEAQGKPGAQWGDKTPANTQLLAELREVFPAARFVHLLRDGVDVVASFMDKDRSGDLGAYARRWREFATDSRALVRALPAQSVEIRYEDMVRDPAAALQPVCKLLGIDWRPAMAEDVSHIGKLGDVTEYGHHANVTRQVSEEYVGKGRRTLDAAQLTALQRMIGAELQQFGYASAQA
jgi:hypothetical protein